MSAEMNLSDFFADIAIRGLLAKSEPLSWWDAMISTAVIIALFAAYFLFEYAVGRSIAALLRAAWRGMKREYDKANYPDKRDHSNEQKD